MWTTKQCNYRKAKLFAALTVCLMLFVLVFAPGATALGSNYVVVGDSGRYFQLEDGNDFLPIGYDQMPDFPESLYLVYPIKKTPGEHSLEYDKEALREYFNKMHDHGVTALRVWGEAPDNGYRYLLLENPVGVFNPAFAQFFDDIFELAEDYKIYILLTPYDTFWQHYSWSYYPYNWTNGGPCHSEGEGLTTDKGFEYEKARMKWFVDRYGNSDYLFGWDIMNEIDWTWGGVSAATMRTWTDRMSSWLLQYERQKWGKNHIITVNTGGLFTFGDRRYIVFQHPNTDFATTHMYYSEIADPTNVIAPAVRVNTTVKLALSQFVSGDRRPYFDSEDGPIDDPIEDEAFENEYYHNMIWAHLASGGAGSNLRWPFRSGGPSDWMFDSDLAMSRIIKNIKWSKFSSENIDTSVTVANTPGHTVIKMACGDTYTALVFVLQDSRSTTGNISGATMSVAGMTAGTYLVKYFEPYSGDLISSQSVDAVSGSVNVTLPDFDTDIVAILVNQSASPTVNRKPDAFITSPASGTGTGQVSSVTVSADAVCAGDTTVSHVDFWANYSDGVTKTWRLLNADYTAPYTYQWDISTFPDQKAVEFRVDVYDNNGVSRTGMGLYNSGSTDTKGGISLERVNGDKTAGYGSIEFPPQNATIDKSKTVTLKARAWDISSDVNEVKFWIQGTPGDPGGTNTLLGEVYTPTSGVYTLDVNLSGYTDSSRWISIDVVDNNSNPTAPADSHTVTLSSSPSDTTVPTGVPTAPAAGAVITSNPVTVSADAFDAVSGVNNVEFKYYYSESLGKDYNAPYSVQWAGTGSSQKVRFSVFVTDNAGNTTVAGRFVGGIFYESAADGDIFAPWCYIYSPDVYASVWPPITLKAVAGDRGSSGVSEVTFKYYLDGLWHTIGSDSNEPYEYVWDPSGIAHGTVVQIGVDVEDMVGNSVSSSDIHSNIRVNSAADINRDEFVNYEDLEILVGQWLQPPGNPSADIAPRPAGDGIVNFLDFAVFAVNWLGG